MEKYGTIEVAAVLLARGEPEAAFAVLTEQQNYPTSGYLTFRVAYMDEDLLRELSSLLFEATKPPAGRSLDGKGSYTVVDVRSPEETKLTVQYRTTLKDPNVAQDEVMEDLIGAGGLGGLFRELATNPSNHAKLPEMLYGGYPGSKEIIPKPIRVTESKAAS